MSDILYSDTGEKKISKGGRAIVTKVVPASNYSCGEVEFIGWRVAHIVMRQQGYSASGQVNYNGNHSEAQNVAVCAVNEPLIVLEKEDLPYILQKKEEEIARIKKQFSDGYKIRDDDRDSLRKQRDELLQKVDTLNYQVRQFEAQEHRSKNGI